MVLLTGEYPYNDPLPIDKNGDFIRDENGHWVSVLPTEDDISALEFRSGSGMSVESLAFIKKLLTVSPASRPSAAEALKDPWFASGHVSTGVVSPRVINNIRNLLQKTNF
jgi:serine/threonine protein kinase